MTQNNKDIHAITNKVKGIARKIITPIEVKNVFTGKMVQTKGIWDTGATGSVVTKSTALALGLTFFGKRKVRGVHGVKEVNEYFVNITLDNKNITLNTRVTECDELSEDNTIGVLIGMNIITMGDFAITNLEGDTAMSFRIPSMQRIDYVKDMQK